MAYTQSISLCSPFELLERAETFWTYQKASPTKPRYFLLCHAIRLVLKAYIASRRPAAQDRFNETFGNDLTELLGRSHQLRSEDKPIDGKRDREIEYGACKVFCSLS